VRSNRFREHFARRAHQRNRSDAFARASVGFTHLVRGQRAHGR
jgi:hypothetical protein